MSKNHEWHMEYSVLMSHTRNWDTIIGWQTEGDWSNMWRNKNCWFSKTDERHQPTDSRSITNSSKIHTQKHTLDDLSVKLLKTKDKTVKANKANKNIIFKEITINMTAGFQKEMKARIQILNKSNCQPRILYSKYTF